MSGKTDEPVNIDANRKPDVGTDSERARGDQSSHNDDGIAPPEPRIQLEYEPIEPGAVRIDSDGAGTRRTKTGRIDRRTRAGRTGSTEEKVSGDLSGLSIKDLLIGIHSMGAAFLGIEELEIDETEAKKMGDALTELGNVYGKTISPKTMAWTNLAAACGMVYGPRIVAYRERLKHEPKKVGPQKVPSGQTGARTAASSPGPIMPTPSDMMPFSDTVGY